MISFDYVFFLCLIEFSIAWALVVTENIQLQMVHVFSARYSFTQSLLCKNLLWSEIDNSGLFPAILEKGPWPKLEKNNQLYIEIGRN